jgi:hypothetical protein
LFFRGCPQENANHLKALEESAIAVHGRPQPHVRNRGHFGGHFRPNFHAYKACTAAFKASSSSLHHCFISTRSGQYLTRHGIACELVEMPFEHGSIAGVLADVAGRRDAAFLVMGAYGHSRLVETVFGGVTREILAAPPLPIFTLH